MSTIFDLVPILKVWPDKNLEPIEGDYYFNLVPFADEEFGGWKFSISGPGNNGPTIARVLIDELDPVIVEQGIHRVAHSLYGIFVQRWPRVNLVSRMTY